MSKVIRQTGLEDGETIDLEWAMSTSEEMVDRITVNIVSAARCEYTELAIEFATRALEYLRTLILSAQLTGVLADEDNRGTILRNMFGETPVEIADLDD